MATEAVQIGFEVFLHDGAKAFGAVREISPHGRSELVIYVENAGEFAVPMSAVKDVHADKVILDPRKLEKRLLQAIGHAHAAEDPSI
jgi:hypothetical protein